MIYRDTLVACPSCGCHFRRADPRCPHCDAAPEATRGSIAPTAVALLFGLAAVFPVASGCSEAGHGGGTGGAGGANLASGSENAVASGPGAGTGGYGNAVVSTYGTSTTGWGGESSWTTTSGDGGSGGGACGDVAEIDADCEACLAGSCCSALSDCEADPMCLACLGGDEASCGSGAAALSLCAHSACDSLCAGSPAVDCAAVLPAPSAGSCVDPGAACNPVTNSGCIAGEACRNGPNGPACEGAAGAVCATCVSDAECPASSVCVYDGLVPLLGHCAAMCCDDGDCSGTCAALDVSSTLGACIAP